MQEIPVWAQREIDPTSLRIRGLPINWDAIRKLSGSFNNTLEEPVQADQIQALKPPQSLYFGIPMVASFIAHIRNPEIPIEYPTLEQIKEAKPWVDRISRFAGRFSLKTQRLIDSFVVTEGENTINKQAKKAVDAIRRLELLDSPTAKADFITDIAVLYKNLASPEEKDGWFTPEEVRIEEKIEEVLEGMDYTVRGGYGNDRFNSNRYPFLAKLTAATRQPNEVVRENYSWKISLAASEVMEGVRSFLQTRGYRNLPEAPKPIEFNLFDLSTYTRALAEQFASGSLAKAKQYLPNYLTLAEQAIPDNPGLIVRQIFDIAEGIVILKAQGKPDQEIVDALFAK